MRILLILLLASGLLSACSTKNLEADYPQERRKERLDKFGKITGDGLTIFGGKRSAGGKSGGGYSAMAVNPILWQSSLETISFMPISNSDPVGGVIATDWYEDPSIKNERYKLNVIIFGGELRADALRVSLFKQEKRNNIWYDAGSSEEMARKIEDKILSRAKELQLSKTQ